MQPAFDLKAAGELYIPNAVRAKTFRCFIGKVRGFGHKALYGPSPERAGVTQSHDLCALTATSATARLAWEGMLPTVAAATT